MKIKKIGYVFHIISYFQTFQIICLFVKTVCLFPLFLEWYVLVMNIDTMLLVIFLFDYREM